MIFIFKKSENMTLVSKELIVLYFLNFGIFSFNVSMCKM